jgi:hypothetical protein
MFLFMIYLHQLCTHILFLPPELRAQLISTSLSENAVGD